MTIALSRVGSFPKRFLQTFCQSPEPTLFDVPGFFIPRILAQEERVLSTFVDHQHQFVIVVWPALGHFAPDCQSRFRDILIAGARDSGLS